MATITPEQLQNKFKNLQEALTNPENIRAIGTTALLRAEGEIKRRVFNNGIATNGTRIGDYVSDWKDNRVSRGLQVRTVDLQDKGDLLRSFRSGLSQKGNPALGFTEDKQRLIASGHTEYREKDIFQPSEKEIKIIQDIIVSEVRKLIIKSYAKTN